MRSNKKGFTIVELVIVIAVIAILAAVLIPTIAGLVKKANATADTQLVSDLNTAIAAYVNGALEGDETGIEEALAAAAEFGIDVTKINAKAEGNEILYDSVNNVFCYFNGENIEYVPEFSGKTEVNDNNKYWVISETISNTYATYYIGSDTVIETSKSFNAGASAVVDVKYVNSGAAQDVIINTNGGKLTVDAPNDEVTHYGNIDNLDIIAVKMGSYNEHGSVNGVATLTYGKINVSNEGKIAVIIANAANTSDVALDITSGGQVGAVFAKNANVAESLNVDGVKNTEVVTDEIAFNELSKKVCYVKNESSNIYYDDIQSAIDNATDETTIIILKSVYYDEVTGSKITVNTGKKIVLDLNGNVIEAKLDNNKSVNLIKVKKGGELTVKDSSANSDGIGDGEIRTTELYNSDPMNVSASVISIDQGKVTIESGKIINNNTNCAWGAYAIDVLTNGTNGDATLIVNGGLVESATYRAIRAFCNSTTNTVDITITGGTVRSGNNNAIWFQNPNDKENNGVLKISGGTIDANGYYENVDRTPLNMGASSNITYSVTGGKFLSNGKNVTDDYN